VEKVELVRVLVKINMDLITVCATMSFAPSMKRTVSQVPMNVERVKLLAPRWIPIDLITSLEFQPTLKILVLARVRVVISLVTITVCAGITYAPSTKKVVFLEPMNVEHAKLLVPTVIPNDSNTSLVYH
jgi:hypothetical protein